MFRISISPDAGSGVGAVFTDRQGGVSGPELGPLNLGRAEADSRDHLAANFELVRRAIDVGRLVTVNQVHGADVLVVDDAFLAGWGPHSHLGDPVPLPVADALVTAAPDVGLVIRVADCVPVLLADPESGVIGAAHAGREGLRRGVLEATVSAMCRLGAVRPVGYVGPHICAACYEVSADLADQVGEEHPEMVASTSWGTSSLDLGASTERQLTKLGVEVVRLDPCTRTEHGLHSHRRDADLAGRGAGVIWRVSRPA